MRPFHPALGPRLREVREQRGLSVRELARRVGCSASLISQIERGVGAPSSGMIYLLAVELRASLDYLFDAVPPPEPHPDPEPAGNVGPPLVTRAAHLAGSAAQGPLAAQDPPAGLGLLTGLGQPAARSQPVAVPDTDVLPGHGVVQRLSTRRAIDLAGGVRWERLTPQTDSRVDFLEVIYEPGGRSLDSGRFIRHNGYEYGVIINGRLRADVGFEVYRLDAGDSIAFPSSTPHQYWNESAEPVHAIWVVVHSEPGLA